MFPLRVHNACTFGLCCHCHQPMIISTLVNDIRSEDHVCLSPLSIKTSRWRIVAAPFAFSVQKFLKKNIFRTAFCAVKFLTFFETTSFYIFCTLTGDNDHLQQNSMELSKPNIIQLLFAQSRGALCHHKSADISGRCERETKKSSLLNCLIKMIQRE